VVHRERRTMTAEGPFVAPSVWRPSFSSFMVMLSLILLLATTEGVCSHPHNWPHQPPKFVSVLILIKIVHAGS